MKKTSSLIDMAKNNIKILDGLLLLAKDVIELNDNELMVLVKKSFDLNKKISDRLLKIIDNERNKQ